MMMNCITTKLSRCLIVLGLLCVLGETPVRLYGHLKLIEARHLTSSESDLLTFLDLAFGRDPFLVTPSDISLSLFEPSTPTVLQVFPPIIGASIIAFMCRSLGGCGS